MILEGTLLAIESDRLTFAADDKEYRIDLAPTTRVTLKGRLANLEALATDQKLRITGPTAGWSEKVLTALQIEILE